MGDAGELLESVSRETLQRLDAFVALLLRWNRTINLIGRSDEQSVWSRHVADSLQLLPFAPPACDYAIDLGSGAGFPGLVLSIAAEIPFTLVEADHRRAAFLNEAIRVTRSAARVVAGRVERVDLAPAPFLTARGFAPLLRILDAAAPITLDTGRIALLKGAGADREVATARQHWEFHLTSTPSVTSEASAILVIERLRRRSSAACAGPTAEK